MIIDFNTYCLNEASIKGIKKELRGTLGRDDRHRMKKLLRKHIVFFSFRKKDGSLRKAVGTLISSFLPELRGGSPKPEHQMVYYDLEKEHWRSFRSYSFIKIIWVKTEDEYVGKIERKKKLEKRKEEIRKKKEEKEKLHHEKDEHVPDKHEKKDVHEEDDEDTKKKEYKVGDKIPEKELMRRSTDFRKGSRKNEFTKKSNDAKKKGELDEDDKDDDKD